MNSPEAANTSLFTSIVLGIINWLSPSNVDIGFKILTGIGALIGMILYAKYYAAAKKAKDVERKLNEEKLRRLKDEE